MTEKTTGTGISQDEEKQNVAADPQDIQDPLDREDVTLVKYMETRIRFRFSRTLHQE